MTTANVFREVSVNLPVVVGEGFVIEAHLIEFDVPQIEVADLKATDDAIQHSMQLTKASQSAMVQLDDPDLIAGFHVTYLSVDIQTAEVIPAIPNVKKGAALHDFRDNPILLPFEQIYFGVISDGAAAARTYRFRFLYKTVKLTTTQLVELVQAIT